MVRLSLGANSVIRITNTVNWAFNARSCVGVVDFRFLRSSGDSLSRGVSKSD